MLGYDNSNTKQLACNGSRCTPTAMTLDVSPDAALAVLKAANKYRRKAKALYRVIYK